MCEFVDIMAESPVVFAKMSELMDFFVGSAIVLAILFFSSLRQ